MSEFVFVTVADIAETLDVPVYRVTRIVDTRAHIFPIRRAGRTRIYPPSVVEDVRNELALGDARHTARAARTGTTP